MENYSRYEPNVIISENVLGYAVNQFANPPSQRINKQVSTEPYSSYCAHCDLTFHELNEYEHHNLTMHGQRKLFHCDFCNATFRRQDHLKRHVQSLHTDLKFCKCPVCDKDCKRQDVLQEHIKSKHSDKPEVYRCRECDYQCTGLLELEKHESTHLLSERHECPRCKTTFKRRDHMVRHIKSQHLNQCSNCPVCGQIYKRKDHVARHVREKHKMGLFNGKLVKSSDIIQ